MDVRPSDNSGEQTRFPEVRRLIEEARKAIERLDALVRKRTLEAIRSQQKK